MAEASIQVKPEIVEMPVPVTRENTVVVGGITGVFPVGTLDITENGEYDVVTKENVNVQIPQDPEAFFNADVAQDITYNSNTVLDFLAGFIKEIPVLRIAESVTSFAPPGGSSEDVYPEMMNGQRVKLVGGSSALVDLGGAGRGKSQRGLIALDMSELVVSPVAKFGSTCSGNGVVTEVRLPSQAVVSPSFGFTFQNCSALKTIDLGGVINDTAGSYTFYNTKSLERLIIRNGSAKLKMDQIAFNGSAIAAGTCQIYVPDSLVDAYKSDSVWRTYAAQIHPLSELPEE